MRIPLGLSILLVASLFALASTPVVAQVGSPTIGTQADAEEQDPFADGPEESDPFASETEVEPPPAESARPPFRWATPSAEANELVYKRLAKSVGTAGLSFTDTPIGEIVEFLKGETGLEIQLDIPALDDLGFSPDEPADCEVRSVPLGVALKLMLKRMECTTVVEDGILLITTEEEAQTHLQPAIHDVRDMAGNDRNLVRLAMVVQQTIEQDSWAENGGEGQIAFLQPGLLIITQTADVQHKVAALLKTLRECKQD